MRRFGQLLFFAACGLILHNAICFFIAICMVVCDVMMIVVIDVLMFIFVQVVLILIVFVVVCVAFVIVIVNFEVKLNKIKKGIKEERD